MITGNRNGPFVPLTNDDADRNGSVAKGFLKVCSVESLGRLSSTKGFIVREIGTGSGNNEPGYRRGETHLALMNLNLPNLIDGVLKWNGSQRPSITEVFMQYNIRKALTSFIC